MYKRSAGGVAEEVAAIEYVALEELKPGMRLGNDVFAFFGGQLALLKKGDVLTETVISRLKRYSVKGVYVDEDKEREESHSLVLPKKQRKRAVDTVESFFEEIQTMEDIGSAANIRAVSSVVSGLVEAIHSHRDVLVNISDLKSYDDYTYHHSVSVSFLSLAIGMYIDMPKLMLHRLGLCSILHDIGKMMIPLEIINKPGRLTPEEFAIVREHPGLGAQYLDKSEIQSNDIVRGVLEHHERVDGAGYPNGLVRNDISLFGRIISVVDVYDALTSKRPYREPMLPSEAAEYLMGNVGAAFDMEIVRAFLKKVEFYPIGTFVRLSDSRIAVIVDNENALRPIVKVTEKGGEILDLFRDKACHKLTIIKCFQEYPLVRKEKTVDFVVKQ